jgi:hypothetical protein
MSAEPEVTRAVDAAIQVVETILEAQRVRNAQDWRAIASIVQNIANTSIPTIGRQATSIKLAESVDMLFRAAPAVGLSQFDVNRTGLAWIQSEARRARVAAGGSSRFRGRRKLTA